MLIVPRTLKTKTITATLSVTVLVNAPAAHVFGRLTDWSVQSEWMVGTTVRATKKEGVGVGGEISAFTGLGPFGFTDTMVITTWDPPRRCDVTHTGRFIRGTGVFVVKSISHQQSAFTWSEDFILPLGILGKLGWPIARPFAKLALHVSLKQFARWAAVQKIV